MYIKYTNVAAGWKPLPYTISQKQFGSQTGREIAKNFHHTYENGCNTARLLH